MDRTYNVTSMKVLPKLGNNDNVVIQLNFTYGDESASLKGVCRLPVPEGIFVPLESVSRATALEWLLANCPNTTEEFDATLDEQVAVKTNQPFIYTWTEAQ